MENNLTISSLITELIEKQRITKKSLYDYLGVTRQGFDWMMKNDSFKIETLHQIASFFNIDISYFFQNSEKQAQSTDKKSLFSGALSNVQPLFFKNEERLRVPVVRLDIPINLSVENGRYVWSGEPDYMEIEKIDEHRYTNLTITFQVSGNSMYPVFRNQSRVLCNYVKREQWEYALGVHIIATSGGTLMLKRIIGKEGNSLILKSDNETYAEMKMPIESIAEIWKAEYICYSPLE